VVEAARVRFRQGGELGDAIEAVDAEAAVEGAVGVAEEVAGAAGGAASQAGDDGEDVSWQGLQAAGRQVVGGLAHCIGRSAATSIATWQ
jgi:hypothetical protein